MIPISFSRFRQSFRFARRGLAEAYRMENSFRIHVVAAVLALLLIVILGVHRLDAALIILLIMTVLILELVNTVVERFVDLLEPRVHTYVGLIKDLMAAATLIVATASVIIAILVLWPYFGIHF